MSAIRTSQSSMTRNRSRSTSSRKMSKSLDLPSSLTSDIFRILHTIILTFCRRIIFAPPTLKILVYFALILLGPFLKDFHLFPQTSLPSNANIFNKYIGQLGWTWLIIFLIPFVYLTSLIYTRGHYGLIGRHLLRLFIATIIWYFISFLLVRIEVLTGICKPMNSRRICHDNRYPWQEGHRFFLLYALLVINEEVRLYGDGWKRIEETNKSNFIDINPIQQTRIRMFSIPIGCLYIALAILTILWEILLLSTVFYFYNILYKFLAASFAVFFWFVTYRLWFRLDSRSQMVPCAPGDGFLTF